MRHRTAVGKLVTSLYAAGRVEFRAGPDDPAPGVPSVTATVPKLDLKGLDQVVEVDPAGRWVVAQGRCRIDALTVFLAGRGLTLVASPAGARSPGGQRTRELTVGAAVIAGSTRSDWVDVLTRSGEITRRPPDGLPPDALVVAAELATSPIATATGASARVTREASASPDPHAVRAGP
jgi:hypothetical protein